MGTCELVACNCFLPPVLPTPHSFLVVPCCRYVPVGLLEHLPVHINDKPDSYYGRNDLETLMASPYAQDWVAISEMLLGPVPAEFSFMPKHKANSYEG